MKTILLVEDDFHIQEIYRTTFIKTGNYTVETASDGQEALVKLGSHIYDLILLDIMLPKKDGLHILQDLKANPPTAKNGQIIVLTNLGNDTVASQAFALGANGFLFKSSMNPDEVLKQISSFLQKPPNA